MKTLKAIIVACLILPLLTGGKCFIVSSFDSGDDDDDEGLTITVNNAETTSSEVTQSLAQTLAVADIASQSSQYVHDIIISDPLSYECDNASSIVTVTVSDLDHSNTVSAGDDLLLNYTNCTKDDVIANGELSIAVQDTKGIDIGRFDSGTDWLITLSVKANAFQVITEDKVLIVDGDMEITLQFDATTALLEATITNNQLTLDDGSQTVLSDVSISQFINLAVMPSSYSLRIDSMSITSDTQNGTITAATETSPVSGMELLNLSECFVDLRTPENGIIDITGKDSNADITIMPDQFVTINTDSNGDSILDRIISSSWTEIHQP